MNTVCWKGPKIEKIKQKGDGSDHECLVILSEVLRSGIRLGWEFGETIDAQSHQCLFIYESKLEDLRSRIEFRHVW